MIIGNNSTKTTRAKLLENWPAYPARVKVYLIVVNRLAQSQSIYLRKHAENSMDWSPWCDEAWETVLRENKPIFLSIGYSSGHWCTVMEPEAFSDRAIAQYMNSHFIPVKVDRKL